MALPNFNINPYVQPYVGGIQKETGELIDQRVQDYDIAAEGYDVLGYQTDTLLQNVAPFEPDRLYGQELMGKYRGVVDQAAQKGDYEFMVRDVKRAARQFGAETSPLLARRKAFDNYKQTVQEQYQKGDIDLEMYNAALGRTIADNSRAPKEAVMTGSFSGFVPTKKTDLTKYADDLIKGMESQGVIGQLVANPDGTYTIRGGEYRTAKDIETAVRNGFNGSSDVRNYGTTLNALGLDDKFNYEKESAINAVMAKYQFYKDKSSQGFQPEWWHDNNKPGPAIINSRDTSFNINTPNKYDGFSIKQGVIVPDNNEYYDEATIGNNTSFFKYIDQTTGNLLTKKEAFARLKKGDTKTTSWEEVGVNQVSLTPEELKEITADNTEKLRKDSQAMFLLNAAQTNDAVREWLRDPEANKENLDTYAKAFSKAWSSPEYMQKTMNAYQEASKNAGVLNSARVFKPQDSEGAVKSITSPASTDEVLNFMGAGQETVILSTDGEDRGDREDANAMLARLTGTDRVISGVTKIGVANWNPAGGSEYGGMRYNITTTKKGGTEPKTTSVIVPLEDPLLQPLQAVQTIMNTGGRGEVPMRMNLGADMAIDARFEVITVPNTNPATKKDQPFIGTIQVKDETGKVVRTLAPQDFADYFKNEILDTISPNYLENRYYRKK